MNRLSANDYINTLHQQISHSVDKIKKRSFPKTETVREGTKKSFVPENGGVNNYSYRLLSGSTAYQLIGQYDNRVESAYAADSYRYASEVMIEPKVLIDFIFKNNREFDFKV